MQLDGNILIIGDSFCQNYSGWPKLLLSKIKHHTALVNGEGGAGWWKIRNNLIKIINNDSFFNSVKLMIIIHTQRERLFSNNPDVFHAQPQVQTGEYLVNHSNELETAVSLHYKYIHDTQFTTWAELQWFKEFNIMCKSVPQVINLFFDTSATESHCSILQGHSVPTGLIDLALVQHNDHRDLIGDGQRGFLNHFTPYNNEVFANQMYNIIQGNAVDFNKLEFARE